MPPPLLQLQDIGLSFGVMPLLSGATLAVATGDRICLQETVRSRAAPH